MNEAILTCKELKSIDFLQQNLLHIVDRTATIILYYKPECKYCQEFIPTFNNLASKVLFIKFKSLNVTKNFMLMNAIYKEHPSFIETFPSIIFYDDREPIYIYDNIRTEEKMLKTILELYENSKNLIVYK